MKVLVTGGAGFIGSHLVDAYLAKGHQVLVLDDLSSGNLDNLKSAFHKGAELVRASLLDADLIQILKDFQPDLINHHAAQKSVRESVSNPQLDCEINLIGLIRLLEAARTTSCRKIIFASSGGAIYGEQDYFPADEKHPTRPLSPYGITKLGSEHYLRFYCGEHGFAAAAMRYSNVYGPRQDPLGEAGVVAIFCSRLIEQKSLTIYGTGEQTRDFVFVEDVVRANMNVEPVLKSYLEVNVGTAVESSVNQLVSDLMQVSGIKVDVQKEARRPGEQDRSLLSVEKARQLLSWQPKINLQEGLRQTYQWFLEKNKMAR